MPTSCCRSTATAFDWIDIRPNPLNYLSHGAMGLASSHALGLGARAAGQADHRARRRRQPADESRQPGDDRRGGAAESLPLRVRERDLRGERRPSRSRAAANVDFAGFARSAGYRTVHEFSDLKIFEQQIGAAAGRAGAGVRRSQDRVERTAGARLQPHPRAAGAQGVPRRARGGLRTPPVRGGERCRDFPVARLAVAGCCDHAAGGGVAHAQRRRSRRIIPTARSPSWSASRRAAASTPSRA